MLITRFLRWWTGELAALLPAALRGASRRRAATLQLEVGEAGTRVHHRMNGRSRELGRIPPAGEPNAGAAREGVVGRVARLNPATTRVLITVPRELGLTKTLSLPLAAEENLPQVLAFQMDRETPFRYEDVHFSYRILRRDREGQRLEVELRVAPRGVADGALSLVEGWEVTPAEVDPTDDEAQALSLGFQPRSFRPGRSARLNGTLAVVNVALLALVVAIPLYQQGAQLERLSAELERVRERAQTAAALRERIEVLEAEVRFLAERKRSQPSTVALLEELSTLLPDSTWLYRLEIRGDQIHLQGISQGASSLIAPMEASGMFRNVRFGSPVTQDPRRGGERFHLSAEIATAETPDA